ncbi:VOC family protein [Patescibacteria group bacterium]|nr:MAG: VOC family protein [Patescibacteria group bacterium]
MKITEIAFVCYPVDDVKRARSFYEGVLGLTPGKVSEGEGYAFIEYYMGEHTLAIGKGAPNFKTGKTGATVALEVDNFDEAIKKLKDNKVEFIMDCLDSPSCKMVLVADPEGNQIMIHKRKVK